MVAGRGADPPEERPEWLPDGWTICTRTRRNGKVDRYYMSPSGQTLRSKAEVMRKENQHKTTNIEHESAAQSTIQIDAKRRSESKSLEHVEDVSSSLPDGWIMETKIRKGGKSSGASYKIYINPATGCKCYSMKEVNRYITGGELSSTKKKATLNSLDTVLMENDGSSIEQPSEMKSASRTKKNKIPTAAVTRNQRPVRRQTSGSSILKSSGIDTSNFTPGINKAGDKVKAGKMKDVCEDQPCFQYAFPDESQEEAADIFESIDKIIRNLSKDLKIPDISFAFDTHMDQGEVDLVDKTEAGHNSSLTVENSTKHLKVGCSGNSTTREQKKVETDSTHPLPRKFRKRTDRHSAAINEDKLNGKSCNGSVDVVSEISVDKVPLETKDMSNGYLPQRANGNSNSNKRSSRLERRATLGTRSEQDDVDPFLSKKKDYKLEDDTRRPEETMKNDIIKAPSSSSSRVSRRLAGLDAGFHANVDINENNLRKNKRLRN